MAGDDTVWGAWVGFVTFYRAGPETLFKVVLGVRWGNPLMVFELGEGIRKECARVCVFRMLPNTVMCDFY